MGVVDDIPQFLDFGCGGFPFSRKDVGSEFTPVGGNVEFERGREDEEMVQEVGGCCVVTERVLALTKVV